MMVFTVAIIDSIHVLETKDLLDALQKKREREREGGKERKEGHA